MELHHKKHHNTYVTGLNTAEENLKQLKSQPETPETVKKAIALQPALKFNGGGHINHSLFWKNLAPPGESKLVKGGKLIELIERDFGSMENLKKEMNTKTAAIQGSGWGWLVSATVMMLESCLSVLIHVSRPPTGPQQEHSQA